MTRHSMPFLMLNLGVEMIFVLHSRLRAQAVPADKAEGVMRDIGSNLFSTAFVSELFTPQPMYTRASVMQVFTTLSNSSVMHLSENSMKKLYDLVFMTVKYQVLTLRHPLELYELTLNHLDAVLELVPPSVRPLMEYATTRVHSLASAFTTGDWAAVRRALLNFFGGRHVRVSVFLENNVQSSATGAFYIPKDTYLSPSPSCLPPGVVRVFAPTASSSSTGVTEGHFEHPDGRLSYPPAIPVGQWDPTNRASRMTTNGFDMYAASTAPSAPAGTAGATSAAGFSDPLGRQTREIPQPAKKTHSSHSSSGGSSVAPASNSAAAAGSAGLMQCERQLAYDAEVSYLAKIAGATNRAPGVQTFELELFDDPAGYGGPSMQQNLAQPAAVPPPPPTATTKGTAAAPTPPAAVPLSRMSASAVQEQNKKLLGIMSDFDSAKRPGGTGGSAASAAKSGGGSDLLDIMDEI